MPSLISRKILLVDDDDGLRRACAAHLQARGFAVEEAKNGTSARWLFSAIRFDLVILDFDLPDGTALDLVRGFKEIEPTIPVIVLSGAGSMELGVSVVKSGAEQCLAKPVDADGLLLIVEEELEHSRNQHNQLAAARRRRARLNPFPYDTAAIPRSPNVTAKIARSDWKLKEVECLYISAVLYANDFNASRSAMQLGIARSTLYAKLCAIQPSALQRGALALDRQSQELLSSGKLKWTLDEIRRFHITTVFSAENYNVAKTAQRLGIGRSTLYAKLKEMNVA